MTARRVRSGGNPISHSLVPLFILIAATLLISACSDGCLSLRKSAVTAKAGRRVLVIAPHPDDEALIAAGVIHGAVLAKDPVTVAVATNGDDTGVEKGLARQAESVKAMSVLGLDEDHVIFLGYGDKSLHSLLKGKLPDGDTARKSHAGKTETYGNRGLGRTDYHTYVTGEPAPYARDSVIADVVQLIRQTKATEIYTTSPYDQHPDHQALNEFVLIAIKTLEGEDYFEKQQTPVVFEATVHFDVAGRNWTQQSTVEIPASLRDDENARGTEVSLSVPDDMKVGSKENLKSKALAEYKSAGADFVQTFVRDEEKFWRLGLETPAAFATREKCVKETE